MLQNYWAKIVDFVFPPLCHCCREPINDNRQIRICDGCLTGISPVESPLCPLCGNPFLHGSCSDHLCGSCIATKPLFDGARSALLFEGAVRELIHQFKYSGNTILRRPLALLAADHLDLFVTGAAAELVIPVPLHKKRLRQRGFNQAVLLGELFARRWRLQLIRNNLRRSRWTEPQVNLPAAERLKNVEGAFTVAVPSEISGKKVLLVDDVYTTGSTVKECARMLRMSGAVSVAVVTVARAAE